MSTRGEDLALHRLRLTERVCVTYDLGRQGTVVRRGPEITEVRWDDGSTADRYVPNHLLRSIGGGIK